MKNNAPASEKVLTELAKIIIGAAKEKRAFTISSPYKSGISSVFSYVANNLEDIVGKKESKGLLTLWTNVVLSSESTLSSLIEQLNYYLPQSKQITKLSGWFGIEKSIQYLLEEDKRFEEIVIIIDSSELLRDESDGLKEKLYQLNYRFLLPLQFVFLYRSEISSDTESRNELKDLYPLVTSNVHYFGIPDKSEAFEIVKKYISEVKLLVPESAVISLLERCGNHPGFIFILLRWFKRNKEILLDPEKIAELDEVKYLFLNIWFSFSESTQAKAVADQLYTNEFLLKTRLKQSDGKWFSPVFGKFVERLSQEVIQMSAEEVKSLMSEQELEVFTLLSGNVGTELSKEEIAKCMWKDQWLDRYSDWAISKVISKIRKKITITGKYKIIAVTGGGYILKAD